MSVTGPSVSLVVLTCNQERFVAEAVRAALAQTWSPLEVVVSDDCSTDRTFEVACEAVAGYRGAHRVVVNRNERNAGLAGHINRLMSSVLGEVVVVAAGDDVALPHRVERLASHLRDHPECFSVHSNMVTIDADGREQGPWIAPGTRPPECTFEGMIEQGVGVHGATQAWRRSLFEVFGPLDTRVVREDAAIPFRAALLGRVDYLDEVLVRYRRHASNLYRLRERMASATELRADWELHAEGAVGGFSTMRADILRLPEGHRGAAYLARVEARLRLAELELQYVTAASVPARARSLLRSIRCGAPARQVARWIAMQWFPRAYLGHVRRAKRASA